MYLQFKLQEVHMPAERLTMRKIREVFRLKFNGDISNRQIAVSCNLAHSTVGEYLFRFKQAALSWPFSNHSARQLEVRSQQSLFLRT